MESAKPPDLATLLRPAEPVGALQAVTGRPVRQRRDVCNVERHSQVTVRRDHVRVVLHGLNLDGRAKPFALEVLRRPILDQYQDVNANAAARRTGGGVQGSREGVDAR